VINYWIHTLVLNLYSFRFNYMLNIDAMMVIHIQWVRVIAILLYSVYIHRITRITIKQAKGHWLFEPVFWRIKKQDCVEDAKDDVTMQ